MTYDIAIIGAGPGGISAAIYAKRSGLNVIVFESKMIGGLLNYTNVVDNYPGFSKISGPDLAMEMYKHFKTFDIDYKNENVNDIVNDDVKVIKTNKGEYKAKNVIIAVGRSRRSLGVPGEGELHGKGISYCAMCDAHFYKDKEVVVVGGGDSSVEEAVYLAKIVRNVTMVVRGKNLIANRGLVDTLEKHKNIKVIYESSVTELVSNNGVLSSVKISNGDNIDCSCVFVYIGFDPVLPFESDLNINRDKGYILVDEHYQTNIDGIYAIGDIIKKDLYQIISAEYEGAMAATHIARRIDKD